MNDGNQYVAGACNIGAQEISRRRRAGWVGAAASLVLLAILLALGVDRWWRLLIFFPAALAASGFLQAYLHFCVGFARRGVSNFGEVGRMDAIGSEASKARDRRRGDQITTYAMLVGALVAMASAVI